MTILLVKIAAALLILGVSLAAGLRPLRLAYQRPGHKIFELGEALGGGIFLGIGLFHMLPDAEQTLHKVFPQAGYPFANLMCAAGFVILLFLEKIALRRSKTDSLTAVPYVLPLVLSVHALIEGTALGINVSLANVLIIFIAIIVHKGSESFALATNLGRSGLIVKKALPLFLLWACMSPLGVATGSVMASTIMGQNGQVVAAIFNAFAAGTFLYIATLHKASHICASEHGNHLQEFLLLLLGLAIMAVVEIWL